MTTDASDTVRQTMTLDLDAMDALAKEAKHMEAYETPWCFPVDDATALIAHVRALRAAMAAERVYQERESIRRVAAEDREAALRAGLEEACEIGRAWASCAMDTDDGRTKQTKRALNDVARIAALRALVKP
jgi:hypothetical protein